MTSVEQVPLPGGLVVGDPVHTPARRDVWWRTAVIYQIYPRSFADADGDGMGDLPGVTSRLPYLASLGIDALWLSPIYTSPQNDAGYDVADYRDVDPRFGTLRDAEELLDRAHALGLRVLFDLVPNHSSSDHPWFQAALAGAPGGPERARYLFRDGRGEDGSQPPNNWQSLFAEAGWSRVTEADGQPGQWYLHLFDITQPDWDWTNDEVREEFDDILRFWLDRGVDGFRIDVAHGLAKAPGLPDGDTFGRPGRPTSAEPMWDQPAVHDIYRRWRRLLNSYNAVEPPDTDRDRILCAEAWVEPTDALMRYVRSDELHQSFNFDFLKTQWVARDLREVITASLQAADSVGAPQTWVLSNHDVVRHVSRLGYPPDESGLERHGLGPDDPQPDVELGRRRARAASAIMVALPGSCYLYQGEELGLPEVTDIAPDERQDPVWLRSHGQRIGRDGCRVPLPWRADAPSFGFGPGDRSWITQPGWFGELAVDRQEGDPQSVLELYRAFLRTRRELELGDGSLAWVDGYGDDVVAFVNGGRDGDDLLVLANLGDQPAALPPGAEVVLASGELDPDGAVPTDTAVWARLG